MDGKKDPSIQISKLQTISERLAGNGFKIDDKMLAMIVLASLAPGWDSIFSTVLATTSADDLTLMEIMPLLKEEWERCQSQNDKSINFACTNIWGGPSQQQWQGRPNNYTNIYQSQDTGQQKPAYVPFKKHFTPSQGSTNSTHPTSTGHGPNWNCNHENWKNKKFAKQAMIEKLKQLELNQASKPDKSNKKDKAKKQTKTVQLVDRTDNLLLQWIETLNQFRVWGFSVSDDAEQQFARIDEVNEEMVSLGTEESYKECLSTNEMMYLVTEDGDMKDVWEFDNGYDAHLYFQQLTKSHIENTMLIQCNDCNHSNSSFLKAASHSNKTVCTVECVIKKVSKNTKKCFNIDTSRDVWIINSGASHHITNVLMDFTDYKPYETPEEVHISKKVVHLICIFYRNKSSSSCPTMYLSMACKSQNKAPPTFSVLYIVFWSLVWSGLFAFFGHNR